jgi:hypothetical protein
MRGHGYATAAPLVVDWYEGILTYLGLLICFLALNSELLRRARL